MAIYPTPTSITSGGITGSGNFTVTLPTGQSFLAFGSWYGFGGASGFTAPTGWTLVATGYSASDQDWTRWGIWKAHAQNSPGTTWNHSISSQGARVRVVGFEQAASVDVYGMANTADEGKTVTLSSVTASKPAVVYRAMMGNVWGSTATPTFAAGPTASSQVGTDTDNFFSVVLYPQFLTSAGPSTAVGITVTSAHNVFFPAAGAVAMVNPPYGTAALNVTWAVAAVGRTPTKGSSALSVDWNILPQGLTPDIQTASGMSGLSYDFQISAYAPVQVDDVTTVWHDTIHPASVTVWTGDTEVPTFVRAVPRGYASVTTMLSDDPFYIASRGGSLDYPEMSMKAYSQAVAWGCPALEVSLNRTVDGVWVGCYDADLNWTSITTGLPAISTMTWAQVQGYRNRQNNGDEPYIRIEDLLSAYSSHPIFINVRFGANYASQLFTLVKKYPGWQKHVMYDYHSMTTFADTARTAGFTTYGYYFEADEAAIASTETHWDLLGMDYSAAQSAWDAIVGEGKPVIGFTVPDVTAAATAVAKGADGLMCSGVRDIVPKTGT